MLVNQRVFLQLQSAKSLDFIVKSLRQELSSVCPWLITGDQEPAQDYRSLGTRQTLQCDFRILENQLFNKDNNKVDVQDFDGLEQALNNTNSMKSTPDYLEPFAARIEKARGEATDFSHKLIQVLVCAAIHEMEKLRPEEFNRDMLKKWAATLNMAKRLGFQRWLNSQGCESKGVLPSPLQQNLRLLNFQSSAYRILLHKSGLVCLGHEHLIQPFHQSYYASMDEENFDINSTWLVIRWLVLAFNESRVAAGLVVLAGSALGGAAASNTQTLASANQVLHNKENIEVFSCFGSDFGVRFTKFKLEYLELRVLD
ncbi:hypothetical protein V6N13_013960 [Hibiscus sabdariffa]|uniref:Uncharacterized protein n=1 Tax=Hibiscus sabdariffa TaxID=183260 RepID=A0ABR2RUK0_9ROSI